MLKNSYSTLITQKHGIIEFKIISHSKIVVTDNFYALSAAANPAAGSQLLSHSDLRHIPHTHFGLFVSASADTMAMDRTLY